MENEKNPEAVEVTTTEAVKPTEETNVTNEVKGNEKTFTQEEFNLALQKEISRKTKGMPSKEELKAFNEWKESQKTELEKQAEREKENQKIAQERDNFERENLLLRKGVKEDDLDYVMFKVSKQEGNFKDNLDVFLTENPKYLSNYKEVEKSVDLGGNHEEKLGEDDSLARKVMGLS